MTRDEIARPTVELADPTSYPAARPGLLERLAGAPCASGRWEPLTIAVAVIGLLVVVGIAWLLDTRINRMMLAQGTARAVDQVEIGVVDHLSADDFVAPVTDQRLTRLAQRLDPVLAHLQRYGLIRLDLYTPGGTIVYSNRAGLRGERIQADDALFRQALNGATASQISTLDGPENADLRLHVARALEVYGPVVVNGRIVGIYELYEDLAPIAPVPRAPPRDGAAPVFGDQETDQSLAPVVDTHELVWLSVVGPFALLLSALLVVAIEAHRLARQEQIEHERLVQQSAEASALRTLDHLKKDLLSAVSHELRTPLSIVHGYAELLYARAPVFDPDQVRQIASEINRGSNMMARIVDDLLEFNQTERGRFRLQQREVELVAIVQETLASFAQQRGAERLVLDAPGPVVVWADPLRLSQVVANLVSNALRYAPTGPVTIRVSAQPDGRALLEVEDRGPGISPEALPHLWEMFYRAPEVVDSPIVGTGIGLAVVKSLVEAHGGTVDVESELKRGATFRVYLPLARRRTAAWPHRPGTALAAPNPIAEPVAGKPPEARQPRCSSLEKP